MVREVDYSYLSFQLNIITTNGSSGKNDMKDDALFWFDMNAVFSGFEQENDQRF